MGKIIVKYNMKFFFINNDLLEFMEFNFMFFIVIGFIGYIKG